MSTKQPAKTDPAAPKFVTLIAQDQDGRELGRLTATSKQFSSGSVGFYCNEKLPNPESGERYQVGINMILIGSKP